MVLLGRCTIASRKHLATLKKKKEKKKKIEKIESTTKTVALQIR